MSWTAAALCGLAGAAGGAVVPRLADRLAVPRGTRPRTVCVHCGTPYPAGVAGWVRPGRPCPGAGGGSWVWTAGGTAVAATVAGAVVPLPLLAVVLPTVLLGALLAVVDLRCRRLPDPLVAALVVVIAGPLSVMSLIAGDPGPLLRALAAAALCGTVYLVTAVLPGAHLGFGDVKLAAVLGLLLGWCGWPAVLTGVVAPHLINGPVAVFLLVTGRAGRRTALPFGPALLAGALIGVLV